MPRMAMAMQSQLKKLKKLMTEKMSLEKAYSSVIRHWERTERADFTFCVPTTRRSAAPPRRFLALKCQIMFNEVIQQNAA